MPGLDGSGGDAELCGDLGQGEIAGVAESLFAAAQLVVVANVADDELVEWAAFAAGQAAGIEDGGDFGVWGSRTRPPVLNWASMRPARIR